MFNVQENGSLYLKETAYVNQGSKTAAATATTAATKQKQKMVKKTPLNPKKRNAVSLKESSSIYLILPSYAERHKAKIKEIISQEKAKLCCNKYYNNIFSNVEFNIAYSNSGNLKNILVRTKL